MEQRTDLLLVAPYDRYASIDRFVACLERELTQRARVRVWRPRPLFGRFSAGAARKWAAYLDKFAIAPRALARAVRNADLVHLTDQSLAIYLRGLRNKPHLINCNDLIAVRAALGEFPEFSPGRPGTALQKMILRGLNAAHHVACLANCTRADLIRLTAIPPDAVSIIPMGLHHPYRPTPENEAQQITARFLPRASFFLHVGGNQWYKNRRGLLEIYRELVRREPAAPNLAVVGEELTPELKRYITESGLSHRVFPINGISDDELCAFYSCARALLFPSFHEGFGWPIIEAQASGCPVLTTDRAPMNEVGGSAAIYLPNETAGSVQILQNFLASSPGEIAAISKAGLENAARFSTERMVVGYMALYSKIATESSPSRFPKPAFA